MGLLELIKGSLGVGQAEEKEVAEVNGQPIKVIEVGSSGTEVYGGYISEEYLAELRGRDWSDTIDKMRRSDGNVRMAINAIKLPLKSSNWFISPIDDSPEAELQKRLLEKALFEDTGRSFTKLLGEILTCLEFGYSIFELTFKPKLNDPELGHYNTLKSIAYRSQRTIERWNVDKSGCLQSILQLADGDLGKSVNLDARFILHFAPDQEGDNFEGMSILRGMYGSWLRKNHFLKLMAAGIEKYAIPIPILEVPEGKENSPEYKNAIAALKKFTSNQSNYITFPQGWKLDIKTTVFEAEKIRNTIEFENKEMVNSILASFLILGQGGASGNRALGDTLSDFFGQTLTYVADHIVEQIHEKVFKPLIKMNFGDRKLLVELRCDGLQEKADKTWAEMISALISGGSVKYDRQLEEYIREKFKLPKIDDETRAQTTTPTPDQTNPLQLSEKKKSKQREAVTLMRETSKGLSQIFKAYLKTLGTEYIESMLKEWDKASSSNEIKAALKADISVPGDYLEGVKTILTMASFEAKQQVKAIFPKGKKLSEFRLATSFEKKAKDQQIKLEQSVDELMKATETFVNDPLNSDAKAALRDARNRFNEQSVSSRKLYEQSLSNFEIQKIKAKAELLLDSQVSDLKKSLGLQYQTSLPSTDSENTIRKDLQERLEVVTSGPIVVSGPDILASQTVNEARLEESRSSGSDEIESYTFVAVDDENTSEICSELSGRTFAPNDPNLDRYSPPLHHNCRSYLAVNLKSFNGNPEIDSSKLELSKAAQKAITLSEPCCDHSSEFDQYAEQVRRTMSQA
jgi:SPP1 gp7 family putative phage head morphogenesis protein